MNEWKDWLNSSIDWLIDSFILSFVHSPQSNENSEEDSAAAIFPHPSSWLAVMEDVNSHNNNHNSNSISSKNGNNEENLFFLLPLDIALEIADQLDDISLLRVSITNKQNIFGKEAVIEIENGYDNYKVWSVIHVGYKLIGTALFWKKLAYLRLNGEDIFEDQLLSIREKNEDQNNYNNNNNNINKKDKRTTIWNYEKRAYFQLKSENIIRK